MQNFTIYILLGGLFLTISYSTSWGQDAFEEAKKFYEQRADGANSFQANSTNIDKAIKAFQTSLEQNLHPEESAALLLNCYYFKGMFTNLSDERQQQIYEKGRILGEEMMTRFPNSVPIKFWYSANIGRWAKVHGFVKAATNGIAKKLRRICHDMITLDPNYQGGGGYRVLAQVHFYSPHIPLLMSWPSNETALELIEKAMQIAPDHPTNRMLHAQILLEFERNKEARQELQHILNMSPRPTHKIEDRYVQYRSKQLLEEHF